MDCINLAQRVVAVQVACSNRGLYPGMTVKFAFLFDFPEDMVRPLAVIMDEPGPTCLMGFRCLGTCG
jgi:hypothetical protein